MADGGQAERAIHELCSAALGRLDPDLPPPLEAAPLGKQRGPRPLDDDTRVLEGLGRAADHRFCGGDQLAVGQHSGGVLGNLKRHTGAQ